MDQKDFFKRGRDRKASFVRWQEDDGLEGVVLWTKVQNDLVFGTKEPKVDEDGNEIMQLLVCVDTGDGKRIMPVREGSNLQEQIDKALAEAGAEEISPGALVNVTVAERVTRGAVTYPTFAVTYEAPPSADDKAPF